jgi:hypothetical protein
MIKGWLNTMSNYEEVHFQKPVASVSPHFSPDRGCARLFLLALLRIAAAFRF